jgi:hypothetical protein
MAQKNKPETMVETAAPNSRHSKITGDFAELLVGCPNAALNAQRSTFRQHWFGVWL